jgi:hypothetical protein
LRIKISSDPDRVLEDRGVDVVGRVDVDPTHELDQLARLSQIMAAGLVQGFADEVECHSNCSVL